MRDSVYPFWSSGHILTPQKTPGKFSGLAAPAGNSPLAHWNQWGAISWRESQALEPCSSGRETKRLMKNERFFSKLGEIWLALLDVCIYIIHIHTH